MSTILPPVTADTTLYPESDGQPMAENTLQFRWIVTVKEGLEALFRDRDDVFVAGDLLWYPVRGEPGICAAPDAMVVLGRPKGDRRSYLQWREGDLAPQVVFEILSPGNRGPEMARKFRFYEQFGVREYYIYDPDDNELEGWQREDEEQPLARIEEMAGWTSPLLGITFHRLPNDLRILRPDGRAFETYEEVDRRAEAERHRADAERHRAESAEARADNAEARAETAEARAERLAARLRELGEEV